MGKGTYKSNDKVYIYTLVENRGLDGGRRGKERLEEEYLLQERGKLEAVALEAIAEDAEEAKEEAIVGRTNLPERFEDSEK